MRRQLAKDLLLPVALLIVFTLVCWCTDLDLELQKFFYVEGEGWIYRNSTFWLSLYYYGGIPALLLSLLAVATLLASLWLQAARPFRKTALFLVLTLLLGPGLIVNVVFKDNWGRPRPREILQFAGQKEFHRVWEKGDPPNYSFPSGHAAVGFYVMCPYFILRSRHRKWAYAFLGAGLAYGSLMGLGRMIQGQHFASDVVWSGGFVYLTAVACFYLLRLDQTSNGAGRDH